MGVEISPMRKVRPRRLFKKNVQVHGGREGLLVRREVSVHDVDGQLGKTDAHRDDFYVVIPYMIH